MSDLQFAVDGEAELIRALKEMDKKARQTIVKRATKKALQPVLAKAKQKVPVEEGDLKASLRLTIRSRKGQVSGSVIAGVKKTKKTLIDAFYAHMVEYGHAAGGWFSRRRVGEGLRRRMSLVQKKLAGNVPAKPFIRPAWDEVGDDRIDQTFQADVLSELEKTFSKQ